ncbi:glycosyltransferase [Flammeovirgaceae bacterium SG7u.111]|nr:glycosyltransferase [Flammeovirgaceae bacterium SG7u.132]WPO33761.1 glycosyltransferase [Flammeovirgaceae bacterium SG7u.111]
MENSLPFVSILIAARNESENILACLRAMEKLDYPKGMFDVWIGNDASEDDTFSKVQMYVEGKPGFHLVDIHEQLGKAKGKANVLAQLAKKAKGEFFLFTDADVEVPASWATDMVNVAQKGYGVVTGFTMIRSNMLWGKLQAVDWLYAQQMIKIVSDLGLPVTSMGNNMLLSRKAYFAVGGYESLPFSIIEDYAMFKAVVGKGFRFKNIMQTGVMAFTQPIEGLLSLLHQRKRWMKGAMKLPFYMLVVLFLQALYFPAILFFSFVNFELALLVFILKTGIQALVIGSGLVRFGQWRNMVALLFYEPYVMVLSFLMVIFYFLPIKVIWKGRVYER